MAVFLEAREIENTKLVRKYYWYKEQKVK